MFFGGACLLVATFRQLPLAATFRQLPLAATFRQLPFAATSAARFVENKINSTLLRLCKYPR